MREIKFRAWSKQDKKYVTHLLVLHLEGILEYPQGGWDVGGFDDSDRYILEQFTGLRAEGNDWKDKQHEIYEGSLIINYSRNGGKPHPVIWSDTHGGWVGKYKDLEYAISYELHEIEVVGSIHDNPDLIN